MSIAIWLQSFGLVDPNADPDCDGHSNLLEFATGSDPTDASSAHMPQLGAGSISFRQLMAPGRLIYQIEESADLQAWDPITLNQTSSSPNGDGTETVTFSYAPSPPRAFLRLKVILE